MQLAWSRIWTRVVVSISYDDNHYTTGTSKYIYMLKETFIIATHTHTHTHTYVCVVFRFSVRVIMLWHTYNVLSYISSHIPLVKKMIQVLNSHQSADCYSDSITTWLDVFYTYDIFFCLPLWTLFSVQLNDFSSWISYLYAALLLCFPMKQITFQTKIVDDKNIYSRSSLNYTRTHICAHAHTHIHTHTHTHTHTHGNYCRAMLDVFRVNLIRDCVVQCNGYRHIKWCEPPEFNFWTWLFVFHFILVHLEKTFLEGLK